MQIKHWSAFRSVVQFLKCTGTVAHGCCLKTRMVSIIKQMYTDDPSEFSTMKSENQRGPGKMTSSLYWPSDRLGPPKRNKIYSILKVHSQEMFSFLKKKNHLPTSINKIYLYKNAMMEFIVLYDKNIFRMRKRDYIHTHMFSLIHLF